MNSRLLNLSALPLSKGHLRGKINAAVCGGRGERGGGKRRAVGVTCRETRGWARLGRAGSTVRREPALGSCIKQGMERSCQRVHSIIWTQPGYPGRKRGPPKRERRAEAEKGRERSRQHLKSLAIILRGTQVLIIHYQRLSLNTKLTWWGHTGLIFRDAPVCIPKKRRNERRERIQPVNSRRCSSV